MGHPWWLRWYKICLQCRRSGSTPGLGRSPGIKRQSTPVVWPGESHGQRSLVGYRLWDCKESDTTEQLTHFCVMSVKAMAYSDRPALQAHTCMLALRRWAHSLLGMVLMGHSSYSFCGEGYFSRLCSEQSFQSGPA